MLSDALGPRARRRVFLGSIVAIVAVAACVYVAYRRLDAKGQLEPEIWRPFTTWPVIKFFLGGLGNTVKVATTAMGIALAVGGPLALARLARNRPVRWLASLYVQFFRALPLYTLILFCFYGLPLAGLDLPSFWALVAGLAIYNSAVLAEIFRAGILSLDRGQGEAAYAIGLGYRQAMTFVVVPQAVRRMVPAIISQLVTLLKDTSLGVLVLYEELFRRARLNADFTQKTIPSLVVAAVMYIVINSLLSMLATRLEARQRRRYGAGRIDVAGADDLAVASAKADAAV